MRVEDAYRAYSPRIREKCRRMLGDGGEAEDVAQETFVRLWQARLGSAEPARVMAWVYRTSTRLAVDRLRRRRSTPAQALDAEFSALLAGGCLEHEVAERDVLARLASQLPEQELEAVLLHRLDRLTQPELADVLQVSERTVRRLLSRFDERVDVLKRGLA